MKETFLESMTYVYADEGGYSNDKGDPGGPTIYGITIIDARLYWKPDATASDVRNMPKSVAADIYVKHYAAPLNYNELPAGVDYAVLDYGVNSGIHRAAKILQKIVGAPVDGVIGPATIAATSKMDPKVLINAIYKERLAFMQSLPIWSLFGKGWSDRVARGRKNALNMVDKYKGIKIPTMPRQAPTKAAGAVIVAGGAAVAAMPHYWPYILGGTILLGLVTWAIIKYKGKQNV